MSINVLVPMDNEKIIAKIESQLETDDTLTVFNLPAYPVRIIDSLFSKTKNDRILFISPFTFVIADNFIEMFRKNDLPFNMYLRTWGEEINDFVKGSKGDFKFSDSICFYKNKYLRNLTDYSNTLCFDDIMKLFIKTSHLNIYVPDTRIETCKVIEKLEELDAIDETKEIVPEVVVDEPVLKKSTAKAKKASVKTTEKKTEEVNVKECNSNSWMD